MDEEQKGSRTLIHLIIHFGTFFFISDKRKKQKWWCDDGFFPMKDEEVYNEMKLIFESR